LQTAYKNETQGPRPQDTDLHPKYRPDIDGLRGIAVLLVVLFHGFPYAVAGGFVGVDIFFVISGFLITSIILQGLERQRFSFLDFYIRRVRRLYPALIVVLVATLGFGWFALFSEEYEALGKHVAGGAGFVANIMQWLEAGYFDRRQELKPLLHLWSLGVEEQYYLIWPVLLALLWRWTRLLPILIGALLLASLALNVALVDSAPDSTFYLIHTRFWELLLGSVLAYLVLRWNQFAPAGKLGALHGSITSALATHRKPVSEIVAGLGLLLLGCSVLFIDRSKHFPGWWALLPCAGAVLLIAAGPHTFINRMALSMRWLVFVGLISYPLYLWHWPLMAFARILSPDEPSRITKGILIVASFVLAWLTYRFVENPLRANRTRTVAAALVVICAAVGIAGLVVRMQEGVPMRAINHSHGNGPLLVAETRKQSEAIRAAEKWEKCDARAMDAVAAELCAVYGDRQATPIVVWGDSHAGAWASVFYRIAQEQNLRVYLFWAGGCPPMVEVRRTDSIARSRGICARFGTAESILEAVRHINPKQIVVIGYWGLYTHSSTIEVAGAGESSREAALQSRLVRTLSIAADIAPVTVFRSMPTLVNDAQRALPRGFPLEPTLEAHKAYEAGLDSAIDAAAAQTANIDVFDPSTITCKQRCAAVLHDTLLYRDTNHISTTGSLLFKDIILKDHLTVLRHARRDPDSAQLN
jgi:peptidoglycan/LPS O-acetylase OafA/YrhL